LDQITTGLQALMGWPMWSIVRRRLKATHENAHRAQTASTLSTLAMCSLTATVTARFARAILVSASH
jgi:hypothetical protein